MEEPGQHAYDFELIKSVLIVTSLQKKSDLHARKLIQDYTGEPAWEPLSELSIEPEVWECVVTIREYDPKFVFCHPDVLLYKPATSIYYRGLCGLSQKAARGHFGAVKPLEEGKPDARLNASKALKMAQTYNRLICSAIKNSTDWTLEDGYRTIIATLGITIDGRMRNKIGGMAEEHIRTIILEYLIDNHLIVEPVIAKEQIPESIRGVEFVLKDNIVMRFGSEPDISFKDQEGNLRATIEVKGGTDTAGALQRFGAVLKSFQDAISKSPDCVNFYLGGVFTPELLTRIRSERSINKHFNIFEMIDNPSVKEEFLSELFHYTLRII